MDGDYEWRRAEGLDFRVRVRGWCSRDVKVVGGSLCGQRGKSSDSDHRSETSSNNLVQGEVELVKAEMSTDVARGQTETTALCRRSEYLDWSVTAVSDGRPQWNFFMQDTPRLRAFTRTWLWIPHAFL